MIPPKTSDEMCPNIQRQRARRTTTDRTQEKDQDLRRKRHGTRHTQEKDQNLRRKRHGDRHKTEQKAVEMTHAHINACETLMRVVLAEVPKETLVKQKYQKPKLQHAHQIGKVTRGRRIAAIGKQGSGELMMRRISTTNGKETHGNLHPNVPWSIRDGVPRGAMQTEVMTVDSKQRNFSASMFATIVGDRTLSRIKRSRSMDNL